jgi:hypothetical protein
MRKASQIARGWLNRAGRSWLETAMRRSGLLWPAEEETAVVA